MVLTYAAYSETIAVKCKMVLTYAAYSETIEEKQIKDKWEDQD